MPRVAKGLGLELPPPVRRPAAKSDAYEAASAARVSSNVAAPGNPPRVVLVTPEPAAPLGTNAIAWDRSFVFEEGASDAAVKLLARFYQKNKFTDLSDTSREGAALLARARVCARMRELGVGSYGVSDFDKLAAKLPDNAEAASVMLRLAAVFGKDPAEITFHGRPLAGVEARQALPTEPIALRTEPPESRLGPSAPEEVVRKFVSDIMRLEPHKSELLWWLTQSSDQTWQSKLNAIRTWARARELGIPGLKEPQWGEILVEMDGSPTMLGALRRLAAAYGDPDELVPLAPGWELSADPAGPLGTFVQEKDKPIALGCRDEDVAGNVERVKSGLPNLPDSFIPINHVSDATAFWARAKELGISGLAEPGWAKLGGALPDSEAAAKGLLRLCKAYGKDPALVLFHGKPLSEVRSAVPPRWTALHRENATAAEALARLDKLVGLKEVKEAITLIKRQLEVNQIRTQRGLPSDVAAMHTEFLGAPGTGKTTVARIYAEVLHSLGRVASPTFVEYSRADLVGQFQGHTAEKTKAALEKGKGGVIFIDEAYSLIQGDRDEFGREALDQLIAFMENNRSDTVVILAGYSKQMEKLREANPGLFSRVTQHVTFPNYSDAELETICQRLLDQKGYAAAPDDVALLARTLGRKRKRPDFANARDVRNAVEAAILRQGGRLAAEGQATDAVVSNAWLQKLTRDDLIPDKAWGPERIQEVLKSLAAVEGLEEAKTFIRQIRALVATNRMREAQGLPVRPVALHAAFLGAPGTGKTMMARIYAQVLACEGALSSGHLVETDRTGLVGKVVGETEDKTLKMLERARGGVLFIDEAYALAKGGDVDFGKQAIDTIVKFMEDNRDDLVVVFAGYPGDMEKLYAMNPGLRSRVGHDIQFQSYADPALGRIAQKEAEEMGYRISPEVVGALGRHLGSMRAAPGFANGRSARNAVEAAVMRQAERIQEEFERTGEAPSKDALVELLPQDLGIPGA